MKRLHVPPRQIFFVLVVAGILLRILFFSISIQQVQPSSDESIACLQAQQIAHGEIQLLFLAQPYLFPMESYFLAPLIGLLPPNALGARLLPMLLNLLAVALGLWVLKRDSRDASKWPGALLILFPSSYYLMMQSAYALPGYTALSLLGVLSLLFAQRATEGRNLLLMASLSGFFAGLSVASHMLALPIALSVFAYVVFRPSVKASGQALLGFLFAAIAGGAPYWVAKLRMEGAHAAVMQRHDWADALERIWNPGLKWTFNAAMGLQSSTFPDGGAIEHAFLPATLTATLLAAALLILIGLRLISLVQRCRSTRRLTFELADVMTAIACLTLLTFGLSKRADSQSYRYLIPAVWTIPFLFNHLYNRAGRLKRPAAAMIILLATWNLLGSYGVMKQWREPEFGRIKASQADLNPVLARLHELELSHAVASYGTAYRLNYMSGGDVIAAQPLNERFPGWPLPFKEAVDASTNVVYVLTDTVRFLKPAIFDRHLRTEGVRSQREVVGDYVLYWDFVQAEALPSRHVFRNAENELKTSHNTGDAHKLSNGSVRDRWMSNAPQEEGMWMEAHFPSPIPLLGMRMSYGLYSHDAAPQLNLIVKTGDQIVAEQMLEFSLEKFLFRNGHPVYGHARQIVRLPAVSATSVRLEVAKARPPFAWSICEWEILTVEP